MDRENILLGNKLIDFLTINQSGKRSPNRNHTIPEIPKEEYKFQ